MTKQWLVSLDTDQIKSFVFATGRLKEIRGASILLDWLNREETLNLAKTSGGQRIYAGGGSAMFIFTDEGKANAFCLAVQERYRKATGAATITGAVVGYEKTQPFSQVVRQAARQLRRAKADGRLPVSLLAQPFWQRCQRCGLYPVTVSERLSDNQTLLLCAVCQTKRDQAKPRQKAAAQPSSGPLARLQQAAAKTGIAWPEHLAEAEELGDLGQQSRPANYLGFIYADGNGIGRIIEHELKDEAALTEFSAILETAMLAAVLEATQPHWSQQSGLLPFIPVLIGGDDIILITTADTALPIAHKICLAFQEKVNQQLAGAQSITKSDDEPLTVAMSAGVVIAKASHPVFALETLAGELLQSAKKLSRTFQQRGHGQVSTLDFRVITSPTANSWEKVLEQEFRLPTPTDAMGHLLTATCRPYPCHRVEGVSRPAWDDLVAAVQRLKQDGFPRNKLHAWQDMLWYDPPIASVLALNQMRQRLNTKHREAMAYIADRLFLEKRSPFSLADELYLLEPFNRQDYLSPLPDMTELYEFIATAATTEDAP